MTQPKETNQNAFKSAVTITVIGVAVITFVVIFLALFVGRWLDGALGTRPWFTLGLVIVSIPVTIVLMLRLVKTATSKLKNTQGNSSTKDTNRGTDDNS